jgi:small subunit ribosomal protein S17
MATMQGTVVRINDAKTVKVEVERSWQHPKYKKYVKRTKSYLCGVTEGLELAVGDLVVMTQVRPLSKRKTMMVTAKLTK